MRFFVITIFLLTCCLSTQAQEKFEPALVFIYSLQFTMSPTIQADVSIYDRDIEITEELERSYIQENLAPNWKKIRKNELAFVQHQDFATLAVLEICRELTYKEVEYHENLLIYPVKDSIQKDRMVYKKIADQRGMSWLVNVHNISLSVQGNKKILSIGLHLYNVLTNRLFLDQTFTLLEDEAEPCEEHMWYCMVKTLSKNIAVAIAHQVDKNRQYHK